MRSTTGDCETRTTEDAGTDNVSIPSLSNRSLTIIPGKAEIKDIAVCISPLIWAIATMDPDCFIAAAASAPSILDSEESSDSISNLPSLILTISEAPPKSAEGTCAEISSGWISESSRPVNNPDEMLAGTRMYDQM